MKNYKKKNTQLISLYVLVLIIALLTTSSYLLISFKNARKLEDEITADIIERLDDKIKALEQERDLAYQEQAMVKNCSLSSVECANQDNLTKSKEFNALVKSFWRLETGNGSSYAWLKHNNAGGIKDSKGNYRVYENKEAGIEDLRKELEAYVRDYGYDLKAIRAEYCGKTCDLDTDLKEITAIYNEEMSRDYE